MRITEMKISSDEKLAKMRALIAFAKEVFEGRLGLNLDEVMYPTFLMAKSPDAKLALHMASMDSKLNLTDDEHKTMAEFLENL